MADSPLTMEAFHDEVIAVGKRRLPEMAVEPGRSVAEVSTRGHALALGNIFRLVRDLTPRSRETMIVEWLSHFSPAADAKADAIAEASGDWEKARTLLRPKLIKALPIMVDRLIARPFVDDLVVSYVIDLGDKDLYVSKDRFAEWRVTRDEVHANAVANLEKMSSGIAADPRRDDKGAILNLRFSDGYDASRLVLPGLRSRLLAEFGSPFYAGVPARDLLIVWSKGEDKFQKDMAEIVRDDAATMDHPVSVKVFAVDEQGVRLA